MESSTTIENEQRLLPGDLAIWFFIFAELLVFGIFFVVYSMQRLQNLELFNQYQETLNKETGAINTVLLITASYFVVRAVEEIKKNNISSCVNWLYASLAMGAGFLMLKSYEFYSKFSVGIGMDTNDFYFFYISLTFFHFLHFILGMIIIFAVVIFAKKGKYSAQEHTGIETAASYWHMVDLVWIVLFPLVYIIR
ncbi:MAG TPA: cytochrome c oxidase subunit 3 family protein [Leucothrix sp.]|nr:cytochrome c oxidase subunit 3 family protein [Leucothrix sp.]